MTIKAWSFVEVRAQLLRQVQSTTLYSTLQKLRDSHYNPWINNSKRNGKKGQF